MADTADEMAQGPSDEAAADTMVHCDIAEA